MPWNGFILLIFSGAFCYLGMGIGISLARVAKLSGRMPQCWDDNVYKYYRWAHLLQQETSITVYRLLTKENKLPFSVCRKQTEVCCPLFPFAANKQKLPLSVSSVFHRHKILDFFIQYRMWPVTYFKKIKFTSLSEGSFPIFWTHKPI